MDLDLHDVNAIEEASDHFLVDHAARGRFRLDKSALPDEVHGVLRSIAKGHEAAQRAIASQAEPEAIGHAAGGAEVPGDPRPPVVIPPSEIEALGPAAVTDAHPEPTPVVEPNPEEELAARMPNPTGADFRMAGAPPRVEQSGESDEKSLADLIGAPKHEGDSFKPTDAERAAMPPPPEPQPSLAASIPSLRRPFSGIAPFRPSPFDAGDLDAALKEQGAGLESQGKVAEGLAAERAKLQDESNKHLEAINRDLADRLAKHQQKIQSTTDWLADPKNAIDPRRLYHQQGAAGAIGSAISIFLSSVGSAMSHAPNMAMQIIDKAVNDDIDAQKANREGKNTLLEKYVAEGRHIEDAARMAKADELTHTAGLLQAAADRWAGPQARAAALEATGKLKAQAFDLKRTAELNDLQIKHLPYAWEAQRKMENLQMEELNLRMQGQQDMAEYQKRMQQAVMNGQVPPAHPVPYAGRTLDAFDDDGAKKAREAVANANELEAALRDVENFRKQNSGGTKTSGEATDYAKILQRRVQGALKAAEQLGTWDAGSAEFLGDMLTRPDAFFTSDDRIESQVNGIRELNRAKLESKLGSLVQGFTPRPIQFTPK